MEIESNESPDRPLEEECSQGVRNLKADESLQPKLTETVGAESTEDKSVLKDAEDDNGRVREGENSFKIPAALIGPRRGKPAQLRSPNSLPTKECVEQPRPTPDHIPSEDNPTVDKAKVSISDKQQIPLQYKEPSWAGKPTADYKVEVLKSGVILETIDIGEKSYHVVGRLPTCDISLAHPTISRYHAVLQYRQSQDEKHPTGFYLYDLGSTHGTFWNGCKIRPNTYVRLQGGHMIRFGCSQRKFIIQTPPEDEEEESELTVTELKTVESTLRFIMHKEKRRLLLLEREQMAREELERAQEEERLRLEKEEAEGIDWGMGEDADEESDLRENPYASTNNEELFLDDPKKSLRGWFEREGHELQYQTEEKGIGQFLCWVDLPIDGVGSRTVRAEAIVKGKKKEAVVQCALEACRILDRHGVLRQATHEARKRKARNWEDDDFYDSDEDTFLDRTGTVEKKREQRMRQVGKLDKKVETYASLLEKHTAISKKIADIESQLKKSEKSKYEETDESNEDALDAFMSNLNSNVYDKASMKKMKLELQNLRKEEENLLKLVNITRPANLPSLTSQPIPDKVSKCTGDKNPSVVRDDENSAPMKKYDLKNENIEADTAELSTSEPIATMEKVKVTSAKRSKTFESSTESSGQEDNSKPCNDKSEITNAEGRKKTESEIAKKKMRNMKRMQQRTEKAAKQTEKGYEDHAYDEDYSMWLPPENQSGDGKTSLNDKYGY